ncbi:16S rRNA (guanine(527)-N(7))-methyltransferase RsmG [Longispora sp. K20-0274]
MTASSPSSPDAGELPDGGALSGAGATSGPGGPTDSGASAGHGDPGSASGAAGAATTSPRPEPDATEPAPGPPPAAARTVFGDQLDAAIAYAELLATEGVVRGLIGPREAPRIWDRHLLNCAVVAELIPLGASVVDVGSGAGLPGIVLAVARPDLQVTLVEPLARRTAFLDEVVDQLDLTGVTVVRGRAEELVGRLAPADIVTARAVAPLDRLAGWCLPLAAVGGRMLAMKGSTAAEEIAEHRNVILRLGGGQARVLSCGAGLIDPETTVVEVVRERVIKQGGSRRSRGR